MRKLLVILAALTVVLVACGDSDDEASDQTTTAAADTTAAPETTAAAETTAAPETTAAAETTAAPETTAAAGVGGGGAVEVELSEWMVDMAAELTAGTTELAISNAGEFAHELVVISGTSYDDLPKLANGAVDEEALGDAVVGRADTVDPGASGTASFELEAGDYVFLCNINLGPNSHAAQGQVLSVAVS